MKFIDVKLTIDVSFGTMTEDQYKDFIKFFKENFGKNEPIDNKKVIDYLSLDKRPFHISSYGLQDDEENENIKNSEINIVC